MLVIIMTDDEEEIISRFRVWNDNVPTKSNIKEFLDNVLPSKYDRGYAYDILCMLIPKNKIGE